MGGTSYALPCYAIALGSNRRHGRHGAPRAVIAAALRELDRTLQTPFGSSEVENHSSEAGEAASRLRSKRTDRGVVAVSPILATPALGPAGRSFANAAAIVRTELDPPALLAVMKDIERRFGRRPGRRWGPRVLDLDIILWSEGAWWSPGLTVPHPEFRRRAFVLQPLAQIAPDWRDPLTGLSVAQLRARAVDRRRPRA